MPKRTVCYTMETALGGAETSVASVAIRANGVIVGVELLGWQQDATEAYAGFGVEITRNIAAGGGTPVVRQNAAVVRDFLVANHEGVGANGSAGMSFAKLYQPLHIPVRENDNINLGTYAPTGANPALSIDTKSAVRANIYVLES